MDTAEIIYIGIKHSVLALNRATGREIWRTKLPSGGGLVTVLCDGRNIFAGSSGRFYCLDLNGTLLWQNELSGLGFGLVCSALPNGLAAPDVAILQAILNQQAAAASAGGASAAH